MIEAMCGKAKRESQVYERMNVLEKQISSLVGIVPDIENRLITALKEPCPEVASEKRVEDPQEPFVPLANRLDAFNNELRRVRIELMSILDRLEL
jgi:hypothetical protein